MDEEKESSNGESIIEKCIDKELDEVIREV